MPTLPPAWRGKLGWSFPAEEEALEIAVRKSTARFMERFGTITPRCPDCNEVLPPSPLEKDGEEPHPDLPSEMTSQQAAHFLGIDPKTLRGYVTAGLIQRYKKPKSYSFWYDTDDLIALKSQLTTVPRMQ